MPRPAPSSRRITAIAAVLAVVWFVRVPGRVTAEEPPLEVRVERADGGVVTGVLEAIDGRSVRLADGITLPLDTVRTVTAAVGGDARARPVVVAGMDGSRLTGDDFTAEGPVAVVTVDRERVEIPIARVRWVSLRPAEEGRPASDPAWLASLPEKPESDLLVVAAATAEPGREFDVVECAIQAVATDVVRVLLDDAAIPVKRGRVLGMQWMRESVPAVGATQVAVVGGALPARTVSWGPDGFVVDDVVRMPRHLLKGVDFAAGRTVRLATLVPDRTDVEPFFGALGRIEELKPFFAPRFTPAEPGGAAGLVVRPRSTVVWRTPAGSRLFRATAAPLAGGQASGAATVVVLLDDREVFRGRIDAASPVEPGVPIEIDATGGRRLTLTVDFVDHGGVGCAVRFVDPRFEK